MTRGKCIHCQKSFLYEQQVGRVRGGGLQRRIRSVCPKCGEENIKRHRQMHSDRMTLLANEMQSREQQEEGLLGLTQEEVAWRLGMTVEGVKYMERTALAKIRNHPQAHRLFALWKAEGAPTPGPQREAGEQILEWQMELSRWRELINIMEEDGGMPLELAEAVRLAQEFQAKVSEATKVISHQ